jgi:hypothetical protein
MDIIHFDLQCGTLTFVDASGYGNTHFERYPIVYLDIQKCIRTDVLDKSNLTGDPVRLPVSDNGYVLGADSECHIWAFAREGKAPAE